MLIQVQSITKVVFTILDNMDIEYIVRIIKCKNTNIIFLVEICAVVKHGVVHIV